MRIGIFTDDYLPRDSGVVTSILNLRKGLIELGHQVYIIAPSHPGYVDTIPDVIRLPSIDPLISQKLRMALPRKKYVGQILGLQLDIVHSATQSSAGIFADYMAKRIKCPHVTTAHTNFAEMIRHYPIRSVTAYLLTSQVYNRYFNNTVRLAMPPKNTNLVETDRQTLLWFKHQMWKTQMVFLNNVNHVIVPSKHMLRIMRYHGLKTRSSIVANGIQLEFYNLPRTRNFVANKQLRVVTVGRLSKEKRQSVLIRAVASLPNVHLDIIGDGPARAQYEKLISSLHVQDRVTIHGSRDHEYIRTILLKSDLFAMASHNFDTQGIVLLEAASAGLPIIYCDKKLSDSVAPDASFLVGKQAKQFCEVFESLLKDAVNLSAMSQRAKQFGRTFSYIDFAHQTIKIYKEAITDFKR